MQLAAFIKNGDALQELTNTNKAEEIHRPPQHSFPPWSYRPAAIPTFAGIGLQNSVTGPGVKDQPLPNRLARVLR